MMDYVSRKNVYSMVEDDDGGASAYENHPYEDKWWWYNVDQEVGEGSMRAFEKYQWIK